ncbi:MAG TPA: hypothetical protein DCF95_09430, partial [Gammaproteobacteria bacterium]|nr:hypothetical protein [Gammaproteobacteria bacterium]
KKKKKTPPQRPGAPKILVWEKKKTAFQSDLGISNIGKRSEYTQGERVIYPASVSTQTVGKT